MNLLQHSRTGPICHCTWPSTLLLVHMIRPLVIIHIRWAVQLISKTKSELTSCRHSHNAWSVEEDETGTYFMLKHVLANFYRALATTTTGKANGLMCFVFVSVLARMWGQLVKFIFSFLYHERVFTLLRSWLLELNWNLFSLEYFWLFFLRSFFLFNVPLSNKTLKL